MDFTFVPQYNGEPTKRRRLAKACDACRSRKKRCHHNPIEDEEDETASTAATSAVHTRQNSTNGSNGLYKGISVRKGKSNRFLSDLSPETRLLERNAAEGECSNAKSMVAVGMWVNKHEYDSLVKQRDAAVEAGLIHGQPEQTTEIATAPTRPRSDQIDALVDIYFTRIHPLMPLLDEPEFRSARAAGRVSEPYLYAVCLIAAKDNSAEAILNTPESEAPLSPRHLCRSLYAAIKTGLATSKHDKITLIRTLALLSMHVEGPEGSEEASLHLMQAMHHCQTLGLHLSASFPDKESKTTKRLFWCVWILDRLNSIMNGRPILMADIDLAIEGFEPGESGFPAFEILLRIVMLMNDIIDYYRPGKDPTMTGWETDFPGFDEIVDVVQGWHLHTNILSTLCIAYAAGAILSHRSKSRAEYASTTPSFVRQSLAAIRIIRHMSPPRLKDLPPLPILPYAVSLALSVSYQHMRQDRYQTQQEDAKADFEACLAILKDLRRTWSSVDGMYALSQKVIEEVNRVPNMAMFRARKATKADKQLEDITSACRHEGEKPEYMSRRKAAASTGLPAGDLEEIITPSHTDMDSLNKDHSLFEGIDDIFGTYLDPNYPISMDFLDELESLAPRGGWPADDTLMNDP